MDKNIEKDWRLKGASKDYLKGCTFIYKKYKKYRDDWEHDHCEFCSAKFKDVDADDVLRYGYSTKNDYWWVCEKCFEDFKDRFGFNIETGEIVPAT